MIQQLSSAADALRPAKSLPQALQSSEYTLPCHWLSMDHNCLARYEELSREIAGLLRQYACPGRGLDIGCGDGRSTYEVQQLLGGDYRLLGLDFDKRAIHFARLFAPEVEFQVCDASGRLPCADASLDFVYSREVLEHIPPNEVGTFVAEQLRVLKVGGVAVVVVPSARLPVPPKHYRHYDAALLQAVFAEFDLIELFGHGRTPQGLISRPLYLLVDRLPGLWRWYRSRWRRTSVQQGDVLIACFRKP